MGRIIQFPVSEDAVQRLEWSDERKVQYRETEAALQQDGLILVVWVVHRYGRGDFITAYYLPKDGKRWVYSLEFDTKSMKSIDKSYSRHKCLEFYEWFMEDHPCQERHVCAPLYILLDNRELRDKYLSGELVDSRLASTQAEKAL